MNESHNKRIKIDRINYLQKAIGEMGYFITTIDVTAGAYEWTTLKVVKHVKTETISRVDLIGSRYYGIGTHDSTINIPVEMLPKIAQWAHEKKREMETELESLLS